MKNSSTLDRPAAPSQRARTSRPQRKRVAPVTVAPAQRRAPSPRRRDRSGLGGHHLNLSTGMLVLVGSFAVAYCMSALAGNIALEGSRKERIATQERANIVAAELSRLRRDMDSMVSMKAIERFAKGQNMELSGQPLGLPQQVQPELKPEGARVATLR